MPAANARVSVFSAQQPARLSKAFSLDEGELVKRPGGSLARGTVETLTLTLQGLAQLIPALGPEHALAYGISPHDRAVVVASAKMDTTQTDMPVVARTREHFAWPAGPGVLMLDYDPPQKAEPMHPEDLRRALYDLCPALEHAPHLLTASASSFVYNGEAQLMGPRGWRVLVLVADATDIPRAGAVLFQRCWLAGHGRIDVSRAGSLLVRGLVDDAVWQPERLDFLAGAACAPPLEQRRPQPVVFNGESGPLDTSAALPDLTEDEQKRFVPLVYDAKREKRPEAEQQQELWIQDRIRGELDGQELEAGEREQRAEQLREVFRHAVSRRILLGDFTLLPDQGDPVAVGEVLDSPEKWHNRRFADPLEPDYGNDRRIAWVNLRAAGRPYLWSHAHGGQRYALHRARRTIRVPAGERVQVVEQALELLRLEGGVFDRGGELVRLDSGGNVHALGLDGVRFRLDGLARWEKFDKRSDGWVPCDAPESVATGVMTQRGDWRLPVLRGVATVPFMDPPTGRMVELDGYDEPTGIVLHCNRLDLWPGVPGRPTKDQVQAALADLWEPFAAFPFVDDVSRGVWLAAVLTAALRVALPTAPGVLFGAPTAGSGKTLIARCMAVLAGAANPAVMTMTSDEPENRKRLFAMARSGAPALLLDNLSGAFESDALCAWLTSEVFSDRVLGQSEVLNVPTRSLVLLTGNNVLLKGDLCRRVLTCAIDPQMERPWSRAFQLDPEAFCRAQRIRLQGAALTVLRATFGQQTRMQGRSASFEVWSDTVRNAVVWVAEQGLMDVADPVLSVEANYESDPESAKLEALLGAWHQAFGDVPTTVQEAIRRAENYPDGPLCDALDEIAGERGSINSRRLGRWIERMNQRIVAGLSFELQGKRDNRKAWRVKSSFSSKSSFGTPSRDNCQKRHLTVIESSARQTTETTKTTPRNWVEGTL